MRLANVDWVIIALFIGAIFTVGLLAGRRSAQNAHSFFLSGRDLPWWMLGTSMVATTFSADTPLLVTDIVRTNGVAGNWVWWSFLLTGMLTVFVYARLWRRSGVLTDLEFYELRYSGRSASAVRAFRSIYLGVFFNVMVMATVALAGIKIAAVIFGTTPVQTLAAAGVLTLVLSLLGGFRAVVVSDVLLFVVAMLGALFTAWAALNHADVKGLDALVAHPALSGKLSLLPDFADQDFALMVFIIPLALQWWSVWYPGAEPGGGGYVAQRMLAARNEDHAMRAVLLFQVAHYALRPWPWIIVALASLIVFPDLASIRAAFPEVDPAVIRHDFAYPAMLTFLPTGMLGLVAASLIAAFVSTLSSQVNWGASYVVNDFYVRFINPDASDAEQVRLGRVASAILLAMASIMALFLESALQAFSILLSIGAGTGALFILRWFWSRISAWSEIAAMLISFVVALIVHFTELPGVSEWQKIAASVGITTVGWLVVTWLTPAVDEAKLISFYQLIRPAGPGWKSVRERAMRQGLEMPEPQERIAAALLSMLLGSLAVYSILFAVGYFLYGQIQMAMLLSIVSAIAIAFVFRLNR